nr:protein ANTAGONIST OF LIKE HETEROCHROMATIN PROTEIN 1-like [Coffea arabica]
MVDATYRNMSGFMAPFRGAHGTHHERVAKVLFNRRHASVRNIIERTFGVLKKRFPIFKRPMQNYLIATQNNIVLVCCTLHNFMRDYVPNDEYFNEEVANGAFADAQIVGEQVQMGQPINTSQQGINNWNENWQAIAAHMNWNAHN